MLYAHVLYLVQRSRPGSFLANVSVTVMGAAHGGIVRPGYPAPELSPRYAANMLGGEGGEGNLNEEKFFHTN